MVLFLVFVSLTEAQYSGWYFGGSNENCDNVCTAKSNKVCVVTQLNAISSGGRLAGARKALVADGRADICAGKQTLQGTGGKRPDLDGGKCYWSSVNSGSNCNEAQNFYRRLCCCASSTTASVGKIACPMEQSDCGSTMMWEPTTWRCLPTSSNCASNYWKDSSLASSSNPPICRACTSGTSVAGSTSINDCVCEPNTYKDSSNACVTCGSDATSPAGTTSIAGCVCNVDFYKNPSNNCVACGASTSPAGTTSIDGCVCNVNFYKNPSKLCVTCGNDATSVAGATSIDGCVCKVDFYKNPENVCTACSDGTSTAGSTSIDACVCNANFYKNPSKLCVTCGSDATSPAGTTSIAGCVCDAGFYMNAAGNACITCGALPATSPVGSTSIDDCACTGAGYWRDTVSNECKSCVVGKFGTTAGIGAKGAGTIPATACQGSAATCAQGTYGASLTTVAKTACDACAASGSGTPAGSMYCLSPTLLRWYVGVEHESCTELCAAKTLDCKPNRMGAVTSNSILAGIDSAITATALIDQRPSLSCSGGTELTPSTSAAAPYKFEDKCFAESTPLYSTCSEKIAATARVCCCLGLGEEPAALCPTSSADCDLIDGKSWDVSTKMCVPCARGRFGSSGSCDGACIAGKFQVDSTTGNRDNTKCSGECAVGKYQSDTSTGNIDNTKCSGLCKKGYYSNIAGLYAETQCKTCAADTYNPLEGQTSCLACTAGWISGEASTKLTDCLETDANCQEGYEPVGGGLCASCKPGKRGQTGATGACLDCGVGKYSSQEKMTSCTRCGVDDYTGIENGTVKTGASKCKTCAKGQLPDSAHVACVTCAIGKYMVKEMLLIPPNSGNSSVGGEIPGRCEECPLRGVKCRDGILNFNDGDEKWWYNFVKDPVVRSGTSMHACFNDECCVFTTTDQSATKLSCDESKGYQGPLCGACDRDNEKGLGFFTRSGRRCLQCWDPAELNWFAFVGVGVGFLFAITYLVAQHSFNALPGEYGATVQKIAISHLQMLGVLGIFRAKGTKVFNEVMARPAEVVGGSVTSMVPIKCALESQIYGPFLLNMALPPLIVAVAALLLIPKTIYERIARKGRVAVNDGDEIIEVPTFVGKYNLPRALALCKQVRRPMTDQYVTEWHEKFHAGRRLAGVAVFVLFGLYPTLVASIASIFNCTEQIDGKAYLVADLTVTCNEGWHIGFIVFALIGVVVYAIGIPLMIVFVTAMKSPLSFSGGLMSVRVTCARRSPEKYALSDVRERFGFLYNGYSTDRSGIVVGWEALVASRKLAVTLAGSVFKDPYLQILVALLILVISALATAYVQPYETWWLNVLDTAGLFALILTQILSILYFYVAHAAHPFMDGHTLEVLVTIVLFVMNFATLLLLFLFWGSEMVNLRDTWREKRSDLFRVASTKEKHTALIQIHRERAEAKAGAELESMSSLLRRISSAESGAEVEAGADVGANAGAAACAAADTEADSEAEAASNEFIPEGKRSLIDKQIQRWVHPSGFAVIDAPLQSFDEDGNVTKYWIWPGIGNTDAGEAMSTAAPELLLRVENRDKISALERLEVGDKYRWADKKTLSLSKKLKKLPDVGNHDCWKHACWDRCRKGKKDGEETDLHRSFFTLPSTKRAAAVVQQQEEVEETRNPSLGLDLSLEMRPGDVTHISSIIKGGEGGGGGGEGRGEGGVGATLLRRGEPSSRLRTTFNPIASARDVFVSQAVEMTEQKPKKTLFDATL